MKARQPIRVVAEMVVTVLRATGRSGADRGALSQS